MVRGKDDSPQMVDLFCRQWGAGRLFTANVSDSWLLKEMLSNGHTCCAYVRPHSEVCVARIMNTPHKKLVVVGARTRGTEFGF